jgi:hypothetical protein
VIKLYFAHNFEARQMLRIVKATVEEGGKFEVNSHWLYEEKSHEETSKLQARVSAETDVKDIVESHVVVFWLDQYGERPGRGKFFEWGFAYGRGKPIILVGSKGLSSPCVFSFLPYGVKVEDTDAFITLIKMMESNPKMLVNMVYEGKLIGRWNDGR